MDAEQRRRMGIARCLKKADVHVRMNEDHLVASVDDAETPEDNSALESALTRITELEHDWVFMFHALGVLAGGWFALAENSLVFDYSDDGLKHRIPDDHLTEGSSGMPDHPMETSCGLGTGLPDKGE